MLLKSILLSFSLLTLISYSSDKHESSLLSFQNPYDHVGIEHNRGLKDVLQSLDEQPSAANIDQVIRGAVELNFKGKPDYLKGINSLPEMPFTYESLNAFLENRVSNQLFQQIKQTENLVESESVLSELLRKLELKEANMSKQLTGNDLELYHMFSAVVKHSAIFWSPESQGGENGIKNLNFNLNSSGKQLLVEYTPYHLMSIKWWKVIVSDGIGAVCGGAVSGPGGAVAGGIGSSACSIVSQW